MKKKKKEEPEVIERELGRVRFVSICAVRIFESEYQSQHEVLHALDEYGRVYEKGYLGWKRIDNDNKLVVEPEETT